MADIYHNKNGDAAVIAASGTQSSKVHVGDYCRGSFRTPTLSGTAFTFEVSNDGTNWDTLRDAAGAAIAAVTVASNKNYRLPQGVFSYRWLRFVSGTTEVADRIILVFLGSGAAS